MPENCANVVHRITKKHEDDLCLFMKYELAYLKKTKKEEPFSVTVFRCSIELVSLILFYGKNYKKIL